MKVLRHISFFVSLLFLLGSHAAQALTSQNLRCEYRAEPLGIDSPQPRLSWTSTSSVRADRQTAYQILVASSPALLAQGTGDLWDTGKVASTQQNHLPYAGKALTTSEQVFWKVRVWDATGAVSAWSSTASWTMGVLKTTDWQAQWIAGPTDTNQSTLLRKDFAVNTGLKRAVIHVSGLGQYEMSLNGAKVGNCLLTPGWTTYAATSLYDTYDVTSLLQAGKTNAVGLLLGNGFYNVSSTSSFGTRYNNGGVAIASGPRKAVVQIRLEYADGTVQTIGTDGTWKTTLGPITFSSSYGGEDYDARLEQAGWNVAGFDASAWSAATLFTGTSGTLKGSSAAALSVTAQEVSQPAASRQISPGVVVYDFGQNAARIPQISVSGPAGSRVKLTPGELLNTDGTMSQLSSQTQYSSNGGSFMTYTLKGGGTESFSPKFYYYGHRYLQVDSLDANGGTSGTLPTTVSLQSSVVSTSSDATGAFSCSNPLFNQIHTLIAWAQRSNEVSLFTDCPHREKLGWLEQDYLNGPSLRYEHDLTVLFEKVTNDMAEGQAASGWVPSLVPFYKMYGGAFGDSPEWGSASIQVPWQQYQADGDVSLLSLRYASMKSYLAYLTGKASGSILNYGLGDWYDLGPNSPGYAQLTPVAVTATATYFLDAQTMAQVAQLLGNNADAAAFTNLASQIRTAFNTNFYNAAAGSYSTGSQTANAMPLALGMVDPANIPRVVNSLVKSVQAAGNRLTSGDIGYRYLLRALADNGRSDLIFAMNNQSSSPGYGYMLAQGATSLTEAWNAEAKSSQDHFMLGQIMEWFYHDLAGIALDTAGPGYQKINIKPTLCGDIASVDASYVSVLGTITSNWSLSGATMTINVGIPVGATATVYVPAGNSASVQEGGISAANASGVQFLGMQNATAVYAVGSGGYVFTSVPILGAPTALNAAPSSTQVALTWSATPLAAGYNVKRAAVAGGPYTTIARNVISTSYVDAGLVNNHSYFYVVSALNPAGESGNSAEAIGTPTLLSNPDFETPVVNGYQYNPGGGSWTFSAQSGSNGSGISGNGSLFTSGNPVAPKGVQAAFLQGNGSIKQTVTGLQPGATYKLTFSASQRATYIHLGQTWNVTLDGSTIGSYAPGASATAYSDYTATFTAAAATQTLAFVGTNTNTGDNTVFLDNVRLAIMGNKLFGAIIGTPGAWNNGASTVDKVFDGDLATYFDAPTANDAWAGLDFGGDINIITQLSYCPRSTLESRLVGGIFQGANAADFSDAVLLFTVTAQPAAGVMTAQTITIAAPFRYVRYVSPPGGYGNVAEVEFDGLPSPPVTPVGLSASGVSNRPCSPGVPRPARLPTGSSGRAAAALTPRLRRIPPARISPIWG